MADKPGTSDARNTQDVISRNIGVFGSWHFWVCAALFMCKFQVAWHQLNIVIFAPKTGYECTLNNTDPCDSKCPGHKFDRSIFTNTIIMQWDLVCLKKVLADMAQTTTMFGILVGNVVFGYFSDRYGRKLPLAYAVLVQLISGIITAVVPWYWALLVGRFIVAFATGGTMMISFVIVMEIVGIKWRTTLGTLYQIPFNLGHLSLALIAYFLRDWRYGQLAISIPSGFLLFYFCVLPESPRWLIATGRPDKAIAIMEKAARTNKLPTDKIASDVKAYAEVIAASGPKSKGNIRDLVRTKNLRIRTIAMCFNWFTTGLCFFGVAQHIGQLGGDILLNVAISASLQIPGTVMTVGSLELLGRRLTLISANLLSGIPLLIVPVLPEKSWSVPMLYAISLFGLMVCFCTIYIYTGELFPTVVRNAGIGTTSMFARVGSLIAPHISSLGTYTFFFVPNIIFGLFPIVAAILCLFLPETKHCVLPETIEEAENFKSKKKREQT